MAFVAKAFTNNVAKSGSTAVAASYTPAAAGNTLVVFCTSDSAGGSLSITDSVNGATGWTNVQSLSDPLPATSLGVSVFPNCTTAARTFTATWSVAPATGCTFEVYEVTAPTSGVVSDHQGQAQTVATGTANVFTPTLTLTGNCTILAATNCVVGAGTPATVGTGFTQDDTNSNNANGAITTAHKSNTSGSQAAVFNAVQAGSQPYATLAVAIFEPGSGGGFNLMGQQCL
jgi:hypothetical protein